MTGQGFLAFLEMISFYRVLFEDIALIVYPMEKRTLLVATTQQALYETL
jgi:hypothetical protein